MAANEMHEMKAGDTRDLAEGAAEPLPGRQTGDGPPSEAASDGTEGRDSPSAKPDPQKDSDKLEAAADPAPPPEKEPAYAWAVLVSAFLCSFFGWGLLFAGGIFQRYYFTARTFGDANQKELAWIGSIAYASCTVLGIFVGRVSDLFGHQKVLAFGTCLVSLALILSSFATSVWHLYCTQGIMWGLGVASLYIPSSGVLVTWWTTRRALAISLTGMGSGLGGFAWPQVAQALLDAVGFRWCYRILAIVSFVVMGSATFILRPKDRNQGKKVEGVKRAPFLDFSFFRSKDYWILSLVGFFVTFGYYVPTYYLAQFTTDIGLSPTTGSLLVGIMNGSALLVRVIQPTLTRVMGPSTFFACAILLGALCQLLIWPFAKNLGGLVTFTVLFGLFAAGGYLGAYPIVVAQAFPKLFASALGLIFFWCAPGGLTGPVISGALFDAHSTIGPDGKRTTDYLPMQMMGGGFMAAAGLVAVWHVVSLRMDVKKRGAEATADAGKRWIPV